MPMLFVQCRSCRTEFPSGVAPVSGTPGGVELLNVLARCPKCGNVSGYNTMDFHFPGPVDAPTEGGVAVPPSATEALERSQQDHSPEASLDAPTGAAPAGSPARRRPRTTPG